MVAQYDVITNQIAKWDTYFVEPIVFGTTDPQNIAHLEEESQAFIVDYEVARGKPFTPDEQQTLQAAKIASLAYSARCEHALNPNETTFPVGSCRFLLAQHLNADKHETNVI